jgi:hypothetical protein
MLRIAGFVGLLALWTALAARAASPPDVRDVLCVTHTGGTYCLTEQDFLNEGADHVLALGSRVLKLWFTANPEKNYPFHSQWPKVESLVELAKTPYYRRVFEKPFTTFVLETFSLVRWDAGHWRTGFSDQQARDEQRQFYEFAKYLLTKYRNTGKTFVLQNWEGDWPLLHGWQGRKQDASPAETRRQIAEFGLPENKVPPEKVRKVIADVTGVVRECQCPYAIYWQTYCNEAVRTPVKENSDLSGFWLLRPDGTKSVAWHALHEILEGRGDQTQ